MLLRLLSPVTMTFCDLKSFPFLLAYIIIISLNTSYPNKTYTKLSWPMSECCFFSALCRGNVGTYSWEKSIAACIFAFDLLSHEWFSSLLSEYPSGVCVNYTGVATAKETNRDKLASKHDPTKASSKPKDAELMCGRKKADLQRGNVWVVTYLASPPVYRSVVYNFLASSW